MSLDKLLLLGDPLLHEQSDLVELSELLQHECDHLDGILATQRAINNKSLKHRPGIYSRIK